MFFRKFHEAADIYQDNFGEGTFTGKGIYNVDVFIKTLENEIPENTVLSHDLLEGSYLRCGLATDILLLDEPFSALDSQTRIEVSNDIYKILKDFQTHIYTLNK